jgi:hypothetical protein
MGSLSFADAVGILVASQKNGSSRRNSVKRTLDDGRRLTIKCNGVCADGEAALAKSLGDYGGKGSLSIPLGDLGAVQQIPGDVNGAPARQLLTIAIYAAADAEPVKPVKLPRRLRDRAKSVEPSANGK